MSSESSSGIGAHEHHELLPTRDITAKPKAFSTLLATQPDKQGGRTAGAGFISTVVHVALISGAVWVTMRANEQAANAEEVEFVELVEDVAPPPPPPPPPVDQPQMQDVVRGFQTLTVPDVVPPDIPPPGAFTITEADYTGEGLEGGSAAGRDTTVAVEVNREEPVFTPYTVAPDLKNRDEVGRALEREYPPLLRDAGIGGTVIIYLFIDEEGVVQNTKVNTSSGHTSLDDAALRVGNVMRFSPAMNRDKKVPVWVSLPITFQVR